MSNAKKYEFTGETKKYFGKILRRIRALVDVRYGVRAGDIGGWIEKESNLPNDIDDHAWVCGNAEVYDNAKVYDNAWVYGDAKVHDYAWVCGNAEVYDNAKVYDNAWVYGDANVYDYAWVCGNAEVYDNAKVCGNAEVYDNAKVYDNAWVYGDAKVYGDALVCSNAKVWKREHLFTITNIGSRNATTTFFHTQGYGVKVKCGCFLGTIDEFLAKVDHTHEGTKHQKTYHAAVELAKIQMEL